MRSVAFWCSVLGVGAMAACVAEPSPFQPCSTDERCLLNYECVEGYCVECPLPDGCGGLRIGSVSFLGGRLCGPDEACIVFPEGTVSSSVTLGIRRSIRPPPLADVRSIPYEYQTSDDLRLRVAVTVEIPISPSVRLADIKVYRLEGTRAVELVGDAAPAYARGSTEKLGTFIAIRRPSSE